MITFNERLLVKLDKSMSSTFSNLEKGESKTTGELILNIQETADKNLIVEIQNLSWCSLGFKSKGINTGKMNCMAKYAKARVKKGKKFYEFNAKIKAEINYEAIREVKGEVWVNDHVSIVPPENFEIILNGKFSENKIKKNPSKSKLKSRFNINEINIDYNYMGGGIGMVDTINMHLKNPGEFRLAQSSRFAALANLGNCDPSLEVNRRELTIQPVGYRDNPSDTNPTGQSLNFQIAAASAVWDKCCIDFNVLPIVLIDDSVLKTSSNIASIRASYTSPSANAIEVFFVDNLLSSVGGGVANACNTAGGNVVMSDTNAGNPQLLAHELGHILGLGHPGATFAGCVQPDANTVMQPSGSPNVPNSTNNTHWNCINVDNPVLATNLSVCCLTHDIPNTMIKDFPEDDGTEPNPGFPGRNFYSMSNAWNRVENMPGGTNPDGTPQHENPYRYNMDGVTLHTNYFFAKVECLEDLNVRDAEVFFYMKHPGSGGGAGNITLLGSVPVPNTLSPTNPETVSLPWTVPSGSPAHSCVFAVIHTPAEPKQDLTNLNWNQTQALVPQDNDWVQRNLSIEQNLPYSIEDLSFPPIIIDYPKASDLIPRSLDFEINVEHIRGIVKFVDIMIPSLDMRFQVGPEENKPILIDKSFTPGSQLVVHSRISFLKNAELPTDQPVEVLGITPRLDEKRMDGYGFSINTGKTSSFIRQLLDRGIGVFAGLGDVYRSKNLEKLRKICREMLLDRCNSVDMLAEKFKEYLECFIGIDKELRKRNERVYKTVGVGQSIDRLLSQQEKEGEFIDSVRDVINRLELMNWMVYQERKEKS